MELLWKWAFIVVILSVEGKLRLEPRAWRSTRTDGCEPEREQWLAGLL
jgi:hypothetical protein